MDIRHEDVELILPVLRKASNIVLLTEWYLILARKYKGVKIRRL
jgi:hypothetical protein